MIARHDVPRLAARARLRHDRVTGGWLLLYPEQGLELDETAADVLRLCTGERSVGAIVEDLAARYAAAPGEVERDVLELLDTLVARALVRLHP